MKTIRMTPARAQDVLDRLDAFAKLQRSATDEAGYIAMVYSCSRSRALVMIAAARAQTMPTPNPEA
jgi:hypothetical protein